MVKMPTLDGTDLAQKRQDIKAYFQACYKRYESLFTLVCDERAYFKKADSLRHPIIFYYGHTAVFFINKLKLAKLIDTRINPKLESLFAVGVDEMSWDDLNEQHYDWPTLEETQEYRDKVYDVVNGLIDSLPIALPITETSPWWVILMGIEHENIHLETSSVLIRQLPLEYIQEQSAWKECKIYGAAPKNQLLEVRGGKVHLGKTKASKLFGWDNEYGTRDVEIPDFKAAKYLTSNAEFLAFVEDGGYENEHLWCSEGKAWKTYTQAKHPLFWRKKEGKYSLRTLSREIDLPLSWPVEVNHLEASAFCVWKSAKLGFKVTLPTEAEYMRLREVSGVEPYVVSQDMRKITADINLEEYASSVPIDRHAHGDFYDVIGNVWQWSNTPMYPFEGFKVHPIYDDFTVPTFDGKHNLINGGSWISCGNLATKRSRYGFRRHFYQHAGFRYIQSEYEEKVTTDYYTTDSIISQYCHFGWGENRLGVENYPAKCAQIALEVMQNRARKKALDVGCAIGRSSFELARGFDEVVGVDFSARFIQEAQNLRDGKELRYILKTEGELQSFQEVSLNNYGLKHIKDKVQFWQADACNLKPDYNGYDLIIALDILDELYDPEIFLKSLGDRLNDRGILIISSTYSWKEDITPRNKWLGGYKMYNQNFTTLEGIKKILCKDFKLLETRDIPLVIQENTRNYQYNISEMSIWEKL